MRLTNKTNDNYTPRQLKLPLEIEKLIDISDPVYTFCEVMDHIDLSRYFVEKGYRTGRPRCDEYIAVVDVKPYASDMECFVPLMEKYHKIYGHYPKYPVADAGYGSYNNYLYCEEHGMEKYMKFTMFKKETTDKKYHKNQYRAVNFKRDESGNLICPNGRKFHFKSRQHVYRNKYGRTEEIYECESCEGCPHKSDCCPKASNKRTIRMNEELTSIHQEVISNLESIHGALLRMNRSIQAEGTFGVLKWDKSYKRLIRRGEKNVILELTLICCGFNLYKYHNKKQRKGQAA